MKKSNAYKIEATTSQNQSILNALPGATNNNYHDDTWFFKTQYGEDIKIDFSDIMRSHSKSEKTPGKPIENLVFTVKTVWIHLAKETTQNQYRARLQGLKIFIFAIKANESGTLTRENALTTIKYLLTHYWENDKLLTSPRIKSYMAFSMLYHIHKWKVILHSIGSDLISSDISKTHIDKAIKVALDDITNGSITYRDWIEGGNYNHLTLDHGRYYIEHCLKFFNTHYVLAKAIAHTLNGAQRIADSIGYQRKPVSDLMPLILKDLSGKDIHFRHPTLSKTYIKKVHTAVLSYYKKAYIEALVSNLLLNELSSRRIVSNSNLEMTRENIDRARIVTWHYLNGPDIDNINYFLSREASISINEVRNEHQRLTNKLSILSIRPPDVNHYASIGILKNEMNDVIYSQPRQLVKLVSEAGMVGFMALSGWRKSEYGFPESAIDIFENDDKLDQHSFPLRYQVNWYVFKTSGKVKQKRELTFDSYLIAKRLGSLHCPDISKPILYREGKRLSTHNNSSSTTQRKVSSVWNHFVDNYEGFKRLDFYQKPIFSMKTRNNYIPLIEARNRVKSEKHLVRFALLDNKRHVKKNWVSRYKTGDLDPEIHQLIDDNLSLEMKAWIDTLPAENLSLKSTTRHASQDLISGAIYPTTHGLRHMWAEAVYRRFDGDVGWMIRSQFKHVSNRMWLAYVRDKDNRQNIEHIKQSVANSLVNNYINQKGSGYAGLMARGLRRLLRKTLILTTEEKKRFTEQVVLPEIASINANPWGYCLIRKRSVRNARCAQSGEARPHIASPELCLGCQHNLLKSGNAEWLIFHISPHVETLKNKDVPHIFKKSSFELIRKAFIQISSLDKNNEALPEIKKAMDDYIEECQ